MPTQPLFNKPTNSSWFWYLPRATGVLTALAGLFVMVSWYAHWRPVLQLMPGTAPMHFNTALCFMLSGVALVLLTFERNKTALWPAGLCLVFTALTAAEHVLGWDLNIDEFFYKHYFDEARMSPGRMSLLAATSFMLVNAGILLVGLKQRWPQRLTVAGMLACIVGALATASLSGFAIGSEASRGWGAYSSMALNTAGIFVVLCVGLLGSAWQAAWRENFNFLRWLPITASVTLMTMVAFIGMANMDALKTATFWRQHTFQVILSSQTFDDNFIDMQRGMRGYVMGNDTNALTAYQAARKQEPEDFNDLLQMTDDNPAQRGRLIDLGAAISRVFTYDEQILSIHDQGGVAAVEKYDLNGEGRLVFGEARDQLKKFRRVEQELLTTRDGVEQAYYQNTAQILVLGSTLAALLLVLSSKMASRELFHRQQAEQRLREITTLQNAIFNSANYAIISLDSNGVVQTFNPAAERMLGYSAGEVIGKATPLLWRDKNEVAAEARMLSAQLGYHVKPGIEIITSRPFNSRAVEYEATFIRRNGRRFPVLVSLTALANETGTVTGFLGVIADITERKRADKMIRESEERFRSALDNAPIGMALVSPTGHWLKVNVALCNMLGYPEEELLKTDFQHVTHPDDLEKDLGLVRQVLDGTLTTYQMEKRYLHKNRSVVHVMLSVSLVRDDHKQPLYFVSQVENITERKLREAEREKLISELQQALSEVKQLSGMIPICGWCKSVRSDEGYWQTVEQYVRSRTNATFSHGMCPACVDKFKKDVMAANFKG